MSNDNTPENKDLDPVVQAVVNALNNPAIFQASYVKQNISEGMSIADRVKARQDAKKAVASAAEEGKAKDWLASRGIKGERAEMRMKKAEEKAARRAMKEEALETEETEQTNNTIVVDIYEENGQIVGIDNGILFYDEELPGVEYIEQFYGPEYVESAINEAVQQKKPAPAKKPATAPKKAAPKPAPAPAKKPAPAPKAAPAPAKKPAPGPVNMMANQGGKSVVQAGAKPKAPAAGASKTSNTKTTGKKTPPAKKADALEPVQIKSKKTGNELQPVTVTSKKKPTDADLQPVAVTSKKKPTDADLQPVNITSTKKPTEPPAQKPGLFSKVGSFLNDTEVGQGIKKVAGDALVGGIGSKLTGGSFKQGAKAGAVGSLLGQAGQAAYDDATGQDDEDQGGDQGGVSQDRGGARVDQRPSGGGAATGKGGKVPINFRIAGQGGTVERGEYKKMKDTGDIESQDVSFNVRNTKTGEMRKISKNDPEYQQYYSRYQKMSQAVTEALLRMGAVLTEEGWVFNDELLESVYTEYEPVDMGSPYYYDSTGRLRIMTESEWTKLGLATVLFERAIAEAMDEVGDEDEDVDNDGDSDSSDDYLSKRRKAIGDAIKAKGKK